MSRAFVKEIDSFETLPDRLVSEHRNLVTPEGMAMIESSVAALQSEVNDAQARGDREAVSKIGRDLRYWVQRLGSAEVQQPVSQSAAVAFGSTVTIERPDGRIQKFRIVGEDEAEPARGTISYVSPMAQALLGRERGDEVQAGPSTAEIVAIS